MINVIIAEDQQLILKDLYSKLLKSDSDINIIATASNGKDAYEKIIELKPDIVFTDINMPLLNGLDMIRKIKEYNLTTKFVIISGYKDFEYAREAINLGVDEYLLKPLILDDIKAIFNKLKAKVLMNKNDYEQHIIDGFINSATVNKPTININFLYKGYYVMLFNAGPYSNFTIDYVTPFCETWNDIDLIEISKKYISPNEKVFLCKGKNSNEVICIFATNTTNMDNLKSFADNIINIYTLKNIPITIGISRSINHIENIGVRSQILRTFIKKNIIFSKSNVFDCSNSEIYLHNHRIFLTDDIEKRIKFYLQHNQKESFINECTKLICTLKENNATQLEIDKCFKSLINSYPKNYIIKDNVSDVELKIDECISVSKDYFELSSNLNVIFEQSIDEYTENNNKNNPLDDIVSASQEYIKMHFSEDININDIASVYSVSPTYFSRLFKKQVGVPPVVFLTKYRIERACLLFKESNFTVKEISELCGYSDQFYFSKAFKSIIGMPPSSYKAKYNQI